MGRGPLVCRAAAPASALASLAGGVRGNTMDVEGIDPAYAALMSRMALGWQSWEGTSGTAPQVEVKIRWAVVGNRLIK